MVRYEAVTFSIFLWPLSFHYLYIKGSLYPMCMYYVFRCTSFLSHLQNTHNSSADSVGISLVGKYAGSSPTNGPVHPTGQLCNNNTELCAEEVDQRIGEHLESKILQWSANTLIQEFAL